MIPTTKAAPATNSRTTGAATRTTGSQGKPGFGRPFNSGTLRDGAAGVVALGCFATAESGRLATADDAPHCRHLIFLPTNSSDTRYTSWHDGQEKGTPCSSSDGFCEAASSSPPSERMLAARSSRSTFAWFGIRGRRGVVAGRSSSIQAGIGPVADGTTSGSPHFRHFTRLPAALSGALILAAQVGQTAETGIATSAVREGRPNTPIIRQGSGKGKHKSQPHLRLRLAAPPPSSFLAGRPFSGRVASPMMSFGGVPTPRLLHEPRRSRPEQ